MTSRKKRAIDRRLARKAEKLKLRRQLQEQKGASERETHTTPARDAWRRLRRNRLAMVGMIILFIFVLMAIFADVLTPYGYDVTDYDSLLLRPSLKHPMGTDNFGRDILTRVITGTRVSLIIGVSAAFMSLVVGGIIGAVAGYYSGMTENILMRIMDIFQSIPAMLLALSIAAVLGAGPVNLTIALSVSALPMFARIVRAAVLSVKSNEYVEAARATGSSAFSIILRHLIPNSLGPIVVQTSFSVAANIQMIAALSYIGLGIQPPTPEWGSMLSVGKKYMTTDPHMIIFPGLMIMIATFVLNALGDGLRDALDPKLKR